MQSKTKLFTALILSGGAFTYGFANQRAEVESIRLDLDLGKIETLRYEVTETNPGVQQLPGQDRPGGARQPGGANQERGELGQTPTGQDGFVPPSSVISYEISVRNGDDGDSDIKELEVKKGKSRGAMAGQPGQAHEDSDGKEMTYIVKVGPEGQIHEIRHEGKANKDGKDNEADENGDDKGHRSGTAMGTGMETQSTESVRDHLHAILGTGLHGRELQQGETLYLGQVRPVGRPIEAGAPQSGDERQREQREQRDAKHEGQKEGQDAYGTQKPKTTTMGQMGKMHGKIELTGKALEFRAVERRAEERVARFRILDEQHTREQAPGQRDRGFGDEQPGQQDRGFGDQQPGQQAGMQDEGRTAGLASYRVGDGMLEELTYLERVGERMGEQRGFGDPQDRGRQQDTFGDLDDDTQDSQQDGQQQEGWGRRDREQETGQERGRQLGETETPRMRSISIRRVES